MTNRPRHKSQRDANQQEIADGLRVCGLYVEDISAHCAYADLRVWGFDHVLWHDAWHLMEVKTMTGELTPTERQFQEDHPGAVQTVRSVEDGLMCFGRVLATEEGR